MNIVSGTIPLLDPNNGVNCGAQIKDIKWLDIVKSSTFNVPIVFRALTCVAYTDFSGGLMHTIFDVADRVILLTCNNETKFDTKIQVLHDTIERSCVAGNDDYSALQSRLEFYPMEKEHI